MAIWLGLFVLFAPAGQDLPELIARIQRAVAANSADQLEQLREPLRNANARYELAYVDWRLYTMLSGNREMQKRVSVYLPEAERQLKELLAANPSDAEAHALLCTVYGQEIGTSPFKGMTIGPKASREIEAAQKLAPDNPRVVLQAGISAFHAPKAFGGGKEKAEREFRRAETLFAAEPADPPWPNWGKADLKVWLDKVAAKQE